MGSVARSYWGNTRVEDSLDQPAVDFLHCTLFVHDKEPPMSASARLVVQMTPAEKASLDQRAQAEGLSTSEFVRRRVSEDGIEDSRQEIEALLSALETCGPAILHSLDNAISEAEALNAAISVLDERTTE